MIDSPRVCVQVQSVYIESQSTPDEERFVFCLYRNHSQSGADACATARALLAYHQRQWP